MPTTEIVAQPQSWAPEWISRPRVMPEDASPKAVLPATHMPRLDARMRATNSEFLRDTLAARFTVCHRGGGRNCVVDGDTFWFGGEKIRIADIDTPETHPARCTSEQELGDAATNRLRALLNAGPFSLAIADDGRDSDRYGRQLRILERDGQSIGSIMVDEGLARAYDGGPRAGWC